MIGLLLKVLGPSLTGLIELMLPDRASSDLSREAGLNDMISQCTGVPAMGSCRTRLWHHDLDWIVKGNPVCRVPSGRRLMMSIGNENDQVI
jgi:hypothetical protein